MSTTVSTTGGNLENGQSWTLSRVAALAREELFALYRTLPAPALREMDGEFDSELPDYSRDEWRRWSEQLGLPYWLGKAYHPEPYNSYDGTGYNLWRNPQDAQAISRNMRFAWKIDRSTVAPGPSLVMYYAPFKNWSGEHDLIDEVRKLAPRLYLCIYHTSEPVPGFTPRQGDQRSEPELFMLTGPVRSYASPDAVET